MLSRRENNDLQERETLQFAQASVSASTTWKFAKPKRDFVVEWVQYINPTGLVADNDNWYTLEVKNGSTLIASIANTDADGGGASLAVNTFVEPLLSAVAGALNGAAGDILTLVATKGGTQTLPAGLLKVGIKYI